MNTKPVFQLLTLCGLLGAWAALWLVPADGFKPNGLLLPIALMFFGSVTALYVLIANFRMWPLGYRPVLTANLVLASVFLALQLYYIFIVLINIWGTQR